MTIKCVFCEEKKPMITSYGYMQYSEEFGPLLQVEQNKCPRFIRDCHSASMHIIDSYPINFCPVCGRKVVKNDNQQKEI